MYARTVNRQSSMDNFSDVVWEMYRADVEMRRSTSVVS